MSLTINMKLSEFQNYIDEIYGIGNVRYFDTSEMLINIQRFLMRGLKGIRKNDKDITKDNLVIAFAWLISVLNRFKIDLEVETLKRFPLVCPYCGEDTCICKLKRREKRLVKKIDVKKLNSLMEYQNMFEKIYPAKNRTLEHAGVHLAEEMGEFSEAMLNYRAIKDDEYFNEVLLEAVDLFSCILGVFNSLNIDLSNELLNKFNKGCHECGKNPCKCNFERIRKFKI